MIHIYYSKYDNGMDVNNEFEFVGITDDTDYDYYYMHFLSSNVHSLLHMHMYKVNLKTDIIIDYNQGQ